MEQSPTPPTLTDIALRQYEAHLRAQSAYHARKRQEKKDNGTYRPRGRPKKVADPPSSQTPA